MFSGPTEGHMAGVAFARCPSTPRRRRPWHENKPFAREELMRRIRQHTISDQVGEINAFLRGHYAYYGVAGNLRCLVKVYRAVERYWRRMLRSRNWAGRRLTWEKYNQI